MINFILGLATGVVATLAAIQQDYITVSCLFVLTLIYPFMDRDIN